MVSMAISTACGAVGAEVAPAREASAEISPRQVGVAAREPAGGVRREHHPDSIRVAHVDVGMVLCRLGRVGDGGHERGRGGERTGGEVGVDGAEHEAPVLQPVEGREVVSAE